MLSLCSSTLMRSSRCISAFQQVLMEYSIFHPFFQILNNFKVRCWTMGCGQRKFRFSLGLPFNHPGFKGWMNALPADWNETEWKSLVAASAPVTLISVHQWAWNGMTISILNGEIISIWRFKWRSNACLLMWIKSGCFTKHMLLIRQRLDVHFHSVKMLLWNSLLVFLSFLIFIISSLSYRNVEI